MKKKTVSVFLCICLLVSCLPISAAAADNILYPNVSNPYDVTFSDLNGQQYSTAADGRYKILVFGRPECGNTASVMYGLGKANACDYADVYMLRVDNQGESLPAFAAESGKCVGAKYFDYESAISYLSWDYFNQFIGSKTFTLPLVIVLDSSDTVVMASTAASGVVNGIKSVIGISDTEQPQTPDTTVREVTIPSSPEYSDEEWEVFRLTNKLRVSLGLNPLTMAPLIQTAADIRVDEVAEYYSHDRPSGESCFTVFEDLGDSYNHVAENIAAGYPTPSAVYTGWKNSSGHYSNMTGSDFVHYGGGFTPSGDGYNTSWVQLFSYSASCSLSNARVSAADTTLELGDSIDSLNGIFTVTCSKHGTCCMPVIEELCTGFDSNTPGLQTITVSAYGKSATFTVTVIDNTVPTRGVTLSSSTLQLTVGDTHTLAATVLPFNATNKNVMWSSSNSSVAAVNSFGVVTAKAVGTAIITATTEDGAMTASCKVTVTSSTVPARGVTLSSSTLQLTVGDTHTLAATVSPFNATNKNVMWSSSNSSVAAVNSFGVVTAKAVGTAIITATTEDGAMTASCKVTVTSSTVPARGVTLSSSTLQLTVGDTHTLAATVSPFNATNKNVMWSSSNSSVATVNSFGVVTAKAAGTAIITATTEDGAMTASCKVTVTSSTVPARGVTLSSSTLQLTVGDTHTLAATVSPFNATNKNVMWSSSNSSVAAVNSFGVVTAKAAGTAIITTTTEDGAMTASCKVTVTTRHYTLSFNTGGGTAIESVTGVEGSTISLSAITPSKNGSVFAGWYSDPSCSTRITSFTFMQNATIYAGWTSEVGQSSFADVTTNDYFYNSVQWAAKNNITKGTDATHFSPNALVTRAQVVTFLWRAASCPEPRGGAGKFTDVTAGSYYEKAVVWAIEHGITKGTSSTTFSPDMVCTRGQVVTFLARFAGVKDEKIASSFTDVESTAYYAAAVKWAKDNKVTEGTSATTFSPNQNCTRAQVVTFLYRWIVK